MSRESIRESLNRVIIEGILAEVNIEEKTFMDGDGRRSEGLSGFIKIKVDDGTPDSPYLIKDRVFAKKLKNNGEPNLAYSLLEEIRDTYVSIAACGNEDEADCVCINRGKIIQNEFYDRNGNLVSAPSVSANFIDKVPRDRLSPSTSFEMELFIESKEPEVDSEGCETGRYVVRGTNVGYGEKINVFTLYAVNPNVINVIENNWDEGSTVYCTGYLNFKNSVETLASKSDFGRTIERQRTVFLEELIIDGGDTAPLDGDAAYEEADIYRLKSERIARLEAMKAKSVKTVQNVARPRGF